jgi:hypothetical protein
LGFDGAQTATSIARNQLARLLRVLQGSVMPDFGGVTSSTFSG